jgi:hypothetical protein
MSNFETSKTLEKINKDSSKETNVETILKEIYDSDEFNSAEGAYDPKKGTDGVFRCGRRYVNFNSTPVFVEFFRFTETCGSDKGRQCPLCEINYPTENNYHIGNPCSSENDGNTNILFNTLNSIKHF